MDTATLEAGHQFILQRPYNRLSFLVVRNGCLVYERYYSGTTRYDARDIASISKSILSALAGIALEQGCLPSLDARLMDYFPEYSTPDLDPRKGDITVRQLLTMNSGIEDAPNWSANPNWIQFVISQPLQSTPGTLWNYSTGATHALAGLLAKACGGNLMNFALPNLFGPLGISSQAMYWHRDPQGYFTGGFVMYQTPRNLAKFGYLYMKGGRWDGRQVVPAAWVEQSTRLALPTAPSSSFPGYGYLWWLDNWLGHDLWVASGAGSQYIFVIPSLQLIVVSTVDDNLSGKSSQAFTLLKQYAMAAVNPAAPAIGTSGVVEAAAAQPAIAPDSFATIYGRDFTPLYSTWADAMPDGRTLPTSLAGVRVRLNGRDCYLSYVSPTQINVLLPPDLTPGTGQIEVINRTGTSTANVEIAAVSPALFSYSLKGKNYGAALFAGTGVYVAPEGALAGVASRPAKALDTIELYANALGPTAGPHPAGQVLDKPYAHAEPASVHVTIGGLPATVLYVGMTYAGLYQVNVEVPAGLAPGDQPVAIEVGGVRSTAAPLLPTASSTESSRLAAENSSAWRRSSSSSSGNSRSSSGR